MKNENVMSDGSKKVKRCTSFSHTDMVPFRDVLESRGSRKLESRKLIIIRRSYASLHDDRMKFDDVWLVSKLQLKIW